MIRVNIIVEGQTEETFVRDVLLGYFVEKNIYLNSIVVRTSKTGKGGGSSYGKIKNDIIKKCKQDQKSYVSSMLDYYGLPMDFPGKSNIKKADIYENVFNLEKAFMQDINQPNFIPNIILHEFEGLLFSDLSMFLKFMPEKTVSLLKKDTVTFTSPEHINDSPQTAPSKRIISYFPSYQKVYHGAALAEIIGVNTIRRKCLHFDEWLKKLELLNADNN